MRNAIALPLCPSAPLPLFPSAPLPLCISDADSGADADAE
jgi:hypothetical protein